MSTLIIRGLNAPLTNEIEHEAPQTDAHSAPKAENRLQVRNNLAKFAGGWTQQDYDEFIENTREFSVIDPEMWK